MGFFFLLNFRLAYLPSLISFWKIFQTDSTWNVAAYYLETKLNLLESFNANLWEGDSFKVFIFYNLSLNCGGGKIRHCLPPHMCEIKYWASLSTVASTSGISPLEKSLTRSFKFHLWRNIVIRNYFLI